MASSTAVAAANAAAWPRMAQQPLQVVPAIACMSPPPACPELFLGVQGMLAVAEGLKLNSSLRQLKMGNNAANTLFGFGTAKASPVTCHGACCACCIKS